VKRKAGDYRFRRRLVALSDLGAVSLCIHITSDWGSVFFFAYLWVIVGNGMRFGSRALIESTLIGLTFFLIVIAKTQYWIDNPHVAGGLLIGLVLLPSYFLILINRLSKVSHRLSEELTSANRAATHDSLSGLSNRAYYFQRLEDKIHEAKRYNEKFIVMYIDLDGFKEINDNWGHNYGDIIIQTVSRRIQSSVRKSDVVARLGGDEFALVLHAVDDTLNISRFTRRLISNIAEQVIVNGNTLRVTASIGISQFPVDGDNAEQLINSADQSMYVSKKSGRNKFTLSSRPGIIFP